MKILILLFLLPLSALSQDNERSSLLFGVIDGVTQRNITKLDSIRVFSAHQKFTLTNPKTGLNFSIKDLTPTDWTDCLITVFLQGYEPAGFKTQLKPGKTRRFSIEMQPLSRPPSLDPSTVYRAIPSFPGGSNKLNCFLNENLDLDVVGQSDLAPKELKIKFMVPPDGKVTDIVFEEAYGSDHINAEILNVLQRMPPWDPAVTDRKRIAKEFKLSIKIPYQIQECKP